MPPANTLRFRLGILLAHLVLIPLMALGVYVNSRPLPFSSATWLDEPWQRRRMAAELMTTKLLIGKSADEIKTLLGSPNTEATNQWIYRLSVSDDSLAASLMVIEFTDGRSVSVTQLDE